MKKPIPEDFYCSECGAFHQDEYDEAVKKYEANMKNSKNKYEVQKSV